MFRKSMRVSENAELSAVVSMLLREKGIFGEDYNMAMNSRLSDLEEVLDVEGIANGNYQGVE